MWHTCKNKQKYHIICKAIGYVITACSGLGYCQTDFLENLPLEKYVDISCLLPLCQSICSSLQHTAGCAACQQWVQCASNKWSWKSHGSRHSKGNRNLLQLAPKMLPLPEIFLHPQTEGLEGGMPSLPPCIQLSAGLAQK